MSQPLVYLVLGAAGSGRRAILADLVVSGLDADARPLLLLSPEETPAPEAVRRRFADAPNFVEQRWRPDASGRLAPALPDGVTHVFVLADGRTNPVDQVEAFHAWLPSTGGTVARIVTVVHCQLASQHAELLRWYDACVHFSDVVLLNRREGVANKWLSDFTARFRKQHFPCLIELVKHDEVANPALILAPEARRMSAIFDDDPLGAGAAVGVAAGALAVGDDEEDDDDDEQTGGAAAAGDDDPDPGVGVDPYFERLAGSGRRAKEIPDIAKYVDR